MRKTRWSLGRVWLTAFAVLGSLVPSSALAQATFHAVGDLPGGPFVSNIRDATKVGGTIYAVGGSAALTQTLCTSPGVPTNCVGSYVIDTGLLWAWDGSTATRTALPMLVTLDPGNTAVATIFAPALTPDAAYIAGVARSAAFSAARQAVRVTRSGLVNLNLNASPFPVLTGNSGAWTISDNGTILYGRANNNGRAARFDVSGSTNSLLPLLSVSDTGSFVAGRGASADGSVAVGVSYVAPFTGTNGRAFRYVHGAGVSALPLLSGGTWNQATGVTPDGNLVVLAGNSAAVPNGEIYLYNATTAATTALGSPMTPWVQSGLAGVTADGSVIITEFFPAAGGAGYSYFRNSTGWFHLESALAAAGVDIFAQGWTELQANGISPDGTLVFGFGFHNENMEGFVAEFPAGFLAAFTGGPAAPSNTAIVGAWSFPNPADSNDRLILALGADGTYYFIQAVAGAGESSAAPGFDRGRYTWNPGTHAFTATTVQDTSGDTGLDGFNGRSGVTFTVNGNTAVISDGVDSYTGTRVTDGPGSVAGAWTFGNAALNDGSGIIVLLQDGSYYFAQDGVADGGGHDGIEKGTYSWNPSTGAFAAASIVVDTNGEWGLSHPSGPITLALSSDGLTATADDGTGPLALTRAVDPVSFGRKSDIIWRHVSLGEVWRWTLTSPTQASEHYIRTIADTNWEIRGHGDQDGDGQPDLLWRNTVNGQVYSWAMNGNAVISETYVATVDPAYDIAGTGDFNRDGRSDILWRNAASGEVWIWLMSGATPVSEVYIDRVDLAYSVRGVGDLDADGKADIVWHNGTTGEVWAWAMDGTTRLSASYVTTVPDTGYQIEGVGDFTGDGKADIAWRHAVRGEVWLWPMSGISVVSENYVATVPDTEYGIVGCGDYDGDGNADLLWHHSSRGEVWFWPMSGTAALAQNYLGTVSDTGYQVAKVK